MTQTTIKEIKDYADELINLLGNLREMEDPKTWIVDFARLICDEIVSKCNGCCDGCPSWETAQEILKALE